jgi:hypothetical protein
VISPWTCITPSIGAIGCKSIATMRGRSPSLVVQHDTRGNKRGSYQQPNITRTDSGTLTVILTCNQVIALLVHRGSGSKPASGSSNIKNQTSKTRKSGADGQKDTWLQLPGAAHRSTTRFTPAKEKSNNLHSWSKLRSPTAQESKTGG